MVERKREPEASLESLNAEKAILGALLRSEHAYFQISERVRQDYFTAEIHRLLFGVIEDISLAGQKLLMPVIISRLPDEYGDGQSTAAYVSTLLHNAEGLNAGDFAEQIAEMAARRRMKAIGQALIKQSSATEKSAGEYAAEAESQLLDVMSLNAPRRPRRIDDLADSVLASARQSRDTDYLPGFDTGLAALDEILGLIMPGDAGFILASQGDGKTALAAQIAMRAALSKPVLMVQYEMTAEQIAARELASASGLTVGEIMEGAFDFHGVDALKRGRAALAPSRNFYVIDDPKLTMRQLRAHVIGLKRTVGLGMVIIDHLRLVRTDQRYKDRFERLADVTGDIKIMAKEQGLPVITLCQRTRTAQRRDDPTPMVDDADAPSIEQDADWVLGLWRKENWLRRNKPNPKASGEDWDKWQGEIRRAEKVAEVICLKRRRGKAFETRQLGWDGPHTRFHDISTKIDFDALKRPTGAPPAADPDDDTPF